MTIPEHTQDLARQDSLALARFNPYRFPPHLSLEEMEVVEGEIIYEVEPHTAGGREDWYVYATVAEDPRELASGEHPVDAVPPEDVPGPEAERPVGVRVKWQRPTELFAEYGAIATGRGMDFAAAMYERMRDRLTRLREGIDPDALGIVSRPEPEFERPNPYLSHDYRAQTPAPPETISR